MSTLRAAPRLQIRPWGVLDSWWSDLPCPGTSAAVALDNNVTAMDNYDKFDDKQSFVHKLLWLAAWAQAMDFGEFGVEPRPLVAPPRYLTHSRRPLELQFDTPRPTRSPPPFVSPAARPVVSVRPSLRYVTQGYGLQ